MKTWGRVVGGPYPRPPGALWFAEFPTIGSTALDYTPPAEPDVVAACDNSVCPVCCPASYAIASTLDNYHAHASP